MIKEFKLPLELTQQEQELKDYIGDKALSERLLLIEFGLEVRPILLKMAKDKKIKLVDDKCGTRIYQKILEGVTVLDEDEVIEDE